MSKNTLVGFTANRDRAWIGHRGINDGGTHAYPGAIPVADVNSRLFGWTANKSRVAVEVPATLETATHTDDAGMPMRWVPQSDRTAIVRSDSNHVMGLFKDSYAPHQYGEWLTGTVSNLLGDTLQISAAGTLKNGAVAFVEVSVPESSHDARSGFDYRPNMLAATSFDGSIATTYIRTVTALICDNQLRASLRENTSQKYKVKHTRNSGFKLESARDALALVTATHDEFQAELDYLIETTVTNEQWERFLDSTVPMVDSKGAPLVKNSLTIAERKRDELSAMYHSDPRANTWHGTALGVVQAVNTWEHHVKSVRGSARWERNALRTITGDYDKVQGDTYATLSKVLAV